VPEGTRHILCLFLNGWNGGWKSPHPSSHRRKENNNFWLLKIEKSRRSNRELWAIWARSANNLIKSLKFFRKIKRERGESKVNVGIKNKNIRVARAWAFCQSKKSKTERRVSCLNSAPYTNHTHTPRWTWRPFSSSSSSIWFQITTK
jgi:hypothetical protein